MGWMDFECGFDAGQVIGKKGWMMIVRCWDGFCWTNVHNFWSFGVGYCDSLDWIPKTEYFSAYIKIIN